eukprot:tig00001339_g8257.t1
MGGSISQAKDLFAQLDKDGSGVLTLDKIMHLQDLPGAKDFALCNSLPILFHFDGSHQGAINLKEFIELVKHVQISEKKHQKKSKKAPNFFQQFLERKLKKGDSDDAKSLEHRKSSSAKGSFGSVHKLHVSSTNVANMHVDRGSSTPIFTSFSVSRSEAGSSDEGDRESHASADDSDEEEDEAAEAGNIVRKFLESLTNQLRGREGRERYMNWLFRLADTHRSEAISMDELELFLQAVARDGVHLEDILFEESSEVRTLCAALRDGARSPTSALRAGTSQVAHKIMEEYNTNHNGQLSKDEFLVLADLIVKEYELCQARVVECIGDYQLARTLGKGSYGVVRTAVNRRDGGRKAMKIIKRGSVSDMSRLDVEIKAMMLLRHPNVVRLEEVLETDDNVCLVMELCGGGSLYEQAMLTPEHPFDEDLARFYFAQLIDGLQYCHQSGVVHRDLRLENLLLDNDGHLKITDFGHAGIFKQGWDIFSTSLVGSLYHLSPEQISGKCYSGEKMDIWSAGVVLYTMLHGQPPFFTENVVELLEAIKAGRYEHLQPVSPEARELIAGMLQVDPERRVSTEQIRKHAWLAGPAKGPVLVRFELPLDPAWLHDVEIPKAVIAEAVRERDIHLHAAPADKSAAWAMHCYCPADNLKFSIAFRRPVSPDPAPYLEFELKEGESLLFRKLARRFQAMCQRRLQDLADRRRSQELKRSSSLPAGLALNKDGPDPSATCPDQPDAPLPTPTQLPPTSAHSAPLPVSPRPTPAAALAPLSPGGHLVPPEGDSSMGRRVSSAGELVPHDAPAREFSVPRPSAFSRSRRGTESGESDPPPLPPPLPAERSPAAAAAAEADAGLDEQARSALDRLLSVNPPAVLASQPSSDDEGTAPAPAPAGPSS